MLRSDWGRLLLHALFWKCLDYNFSAVVVLEADSGTLGNIEGQSLGNYGGWNNYEK